MSGKFLQITKTKFSYVGFGRIYVVFTTNGKTRRRVTSFFSKTTYPTSDIRPKNPHFRRRFHVVLRLYRYVVFTSHDVILFTGHRGF